MFLSKKEKIQKNSLESLNTFKEIYPLLLIELKHYLEIIDFRLKELEQKILTKRKEFFKELPEEENRKFRNEIVGTVFLTISLFLVYLLFCYIYTIPIDFLIPASQIIEFILPFIKLNLTTKPYLEMKNIMYEVTPLYYFDLNSKFVIIFFF